MARRDIFKPEHRHAERFALVVRLDASHAHQLFVVDAQLVAERTQVLFDQAAVETVVPGRDRRMGGKDRVLGNFADRVVERQAVVLHPLANPFERGKDAVSFVQMINAGHDSQGGQCFDPAHAQHQLLADARAVIAAVQPAGQVAVFRAVAVDVAIQQIEVHPPNAHQPHLGQQLAGAGGDLHRHVLAGRIAGGLHRHVFDFRVEIFFALIAFGVEMLLEIALVVEQPDGHQRDTQSAGAFDVVAGKDAQAAGVDRHRFVDAEFGRKIGDRLAAQHAGVGAGPRLLVVHVFLQPAIGVVDAAVEDQFGCPHFQTLRRELGQQCDRIMIKLAPADRIEIAKQVDDFGVPGPPQVMGQGKTLVVKRFAQSSARLGFGAASTGAVTIRLIRNLSQAENYEPDYSGSSE